MNGIIVFIYGAVLLSGLSLATNGKHRTVGKPVASYSYPNPTYVYPPLPPAPATTYRYDIRYNPVKYGYVAPPYPTAALPPPLPVPVPQEYAVPYPWAAYASPVPAPAVPPVPAYTSPVYDPAYAHHFIDRHLAARHHHHHHH